MDMDPAERGGVEWVSEFCPVKGSNTRHEVRIFCAICAAKVRLNFSLTEFSQLESDVILASYRKWRQRLI